MTLPYCKNFAERAVAVGVQTVMVTDVMQRFSDNFNTFVLDLESMNLEIAVVTSAVDVSGHETNIRVLQGTTVMTISLTQYSPWAMCKKRAFDIVVSLIALLVSAIVSVPVAIAIKLTDGGPIFYMQTRVGRRGKTFKMIKFRSMVVNADKMKAELAEENGQKGRFIFKMKDDPRVTKMGKFIRKFSIDELPQFLNVLKGDMSLVGPRPERPYFVNKFKEEIPRYMIKHQVRPGMTGWAQVNGYRGDTSITKRIECDLYYVENWTLLLDFKILFLTFFGRNTNKNAY